MLLLVWQYSRFEQQFDGILFSGSAIALTLPRREARFSFHDVTWYSVTWNIQNYLSDPSCHQGPSCLGSPDLLEAPFFPVDQEVPVLEAPEALLYQGGLAVQEILDHLGLRLHDPPGNVHTISQLLIFESPWTQTSHCHKLMKHMEKAPNSRRQWLNSKCNLKWLTQILLNILDIHIYIYMWVVCVCCLKYRRSYGCEVLKTE